MNFRMSRLRSFIVLLVFILLQGADSWEWSDVIGGSENVSFRTATLTMMQVSELRVRDIRRRLLRQHGYSPDEVSRVLDKKELIQMLSFEEHKEREQERHQLKRFVIIRGIITLLIAVLLAFFWPVLQQAYEVGCVNLVVYTDRKKYEATRCYEIRSGTGFVGILAMAVVDGLRLWLSASILLSWVMTSKFFFPTPNLTINPAKMMGGEVSQGPMSRFGLNVGPMALSWGLQFLAGRVERWTGQAMSRSYQSQKRKARDSETPEEKAARKAARKAAKRAARQEREEELLKHQAEELQRRREAADKATESLFPMANNSQVPPMIEDEPTPHRSKAIDEFQKQMDECSMDDLD